MQGQWLSLSEEELGCISSILLGCKQCFGETVVPSHIARRNDTDGPGMPIADVLTDMQNLIKTFIRFEPRHHESILSCILNYEDIETNAFAFPQTKETTEIFEIMEIQGHRPGFTEILKFLVPFMIANQTPEESTRSFYLSLAQLRCVKVDTLCSYVLAGLMTIEKTAENEKVLNNAINILYLLKIIINFNNLYIFRHYGHLELVEKLLPATGLWEILLREPHDLFEAPVLAGLKVKTFQHIATFLQAPCGEALSSEELCFHVTTKMARSLQYASPYHVNLQQNDINPLRILTISQSIQTIIENAREMVNTQKVHSTHWLFHFSHLARMENLKVEYDPKVGLSILHVDAGNGIGQYLFLDSLREALASSGLGCPLRIFACQADLLRIPQNYALLGFALSKELSKLSIANMVKYVCTAPFFYDPVTRTAVSRTPPDINWVRVQALGHKTILMTECRDAILQRLEVFMKREHALEKIASFERKYGLALTQGADIADCRFYSNFLKKQLARRYRGDPFAKMSVEAIQSKFNATDEEHTLRKAAAGNGCIDDFAFLVAQFQGMSLDVPDGEPAKGFFPLQLAIKFDHPQRALRLIETGKVDPKLNNKQKQNAKDCFEAAPKESKVKMNPKLTNYFSKLQ